MSRKVDAWACNRIYQRGIHLHKYAWFHVHPKVLFKGGGFYCTWFLISGGAWAAVQREFAEFMSVVNMYHKILDVPKHWTKRTTKVEKGEAIWVRLGFFQHSFGFLCLRSSCILFEPFFELTPAIFWRACNYVSWDLKYWQKLVQNQKGGISTLMWSNFWSQKGQFPIALCCW